MAEERETEAVELKPQGQTDAMEQRSEVTAAPTISQTELLMDERYESRTCGQAPELVARLRSAQVLHDGGDSDALRSLCDELLGALRCSGSAAVLVAPPMGQPSCVVVRGQAPYAVVVWLLLDPLDIDSKQTTFVLRDAPPVALEPHANTEAIFGALYKLKPAAQ